MTSIGYGRRVALQVAAQDAAGTDWPCERPESVPHRWLCRPGSHGFIDGVVNVSEPTSERSPDLIAKQRSRDGVSSAAAPLQSSEPSPNPNSNWSTLAAGASPALAADSTSTASMRQQLLIADDVAVILRVPRSLVYALARRRELPMVRVGERYVRFRATTIERWVESQETCGAQRPAPAPARDAVRRKRSVSLRDAVG